MVKFKEFKLDLLLEPQSPMLHFQWNQKGVSLRASEVKPKLDRFLLKKLCKKEELDMEQIKKKESIKHMFTSPDHNALNYKMEIGTNKRPIVIDLEEKGTRFDIHYANSGKPWTDKIRGLLFEPMVTILCFNQELRSLIEENIVEFFLVTNFGTMQNKGFGSFIPKECNFKVKLEEKEIQRIAGYLKEKAGASQCFTITFEGVPRFTPDMKDCIQYYKKIFAEIKTFYGTMKSGQNFNVYVKSYLFKYMHNKNIDNEKAWMKQNKLAPILAKPEHKKNTIEVDKNPKYVRALLGIGPSVTFRARLEKFKNKEGKECYRLAGDKIVISIKNDEIERVTSPICFKIVRNVVFIYAFPVPDGIYNQEFQFSKSKENADVKTLRTPSKEDFEIQEFLRSYVEYYNGELSTKITIRKKVGVISG